MEGLFKTAVGGFKKEDVLAYIDRQETEFREKEADYKKQLRQAADRLEQEQKARKAQEDKAAELSRLLEAAARQNGEKEKQMDEARQQADGAVEEAARAQAETERLRQEMQRLRLAQSRKEAELSDSRAAVERLKAENSRSGQSEERISRVLVEAQATADRIVEKARQSSAEILSQAREKCAALVESSEDFRRDVASLRAEIGGAAGRLDGTLLTMEDEAEKFRNTYAHAFDSEEESPAEEETPAADAGGAQFDFTSSRPQD